MKKGFTLIEVLCVILILSLITTMAVNSVLKLTKNSKENLYCAKIAVIKSAAQDYSQTISKELEASNTYYKGYKSVTIPLETLVKNNFLQPAQAQDVINPLNNTSMNDTPIIIYLVNGKVEIYIETNNICEK